MLTLPRPLNGFRKSFELLPLPLTITTVVTTLHVLLPKSTLAEHRSRYEKKLKNTNKNSIIPKEQIQKSLEQNHTHNFDIIQNLLVVSHCSTKTLL